MLWKQTPFVGSKKDVCDSLTAEAMLHHSKHFSMLSFLTPGILQPTSGILLLGQNSVAKPFNILISIETHWYGGGETSWSWLWWHVGGLPVMLHKSFCFPEFLQLLIICAGRHAFWCRQSWTAKSSSAGWRERRAEVCLLFSQYSRIFTHTHTGKPTHWEHLTVVQWLKPCMYACECVHMSLLPLQLLSSPLVLLVESFDIVSKPGFLWPALMLLLSACLVISAPTSSSPPSPLSLFLSMGHWELYSPLSIFNLRLPLPMSYFTLLSPFISFQSLCCDVYFALILLSLFSLLFRWRGGVLSSHWHHFCPTRISVFKLLNYISCQKCWLFALLCFYNYYYYLMTMLWI